MINKEKNMISIIKFKKLNKIPINIKILLNLIQRKETRQMNFLRNFLRQKKNKNLTILIFIMIIIIIILKNKMMKKKVINKNKMNNLQKIRIKIIKIFYNCQNKN